MRNVSDKIVKKMRTHVLCSILLFRKSYLLWNNVKNMV